MMKDFKFHTPSPVYFGHETVKKNAELIASYGKKAYIVTSRFPAGTVNKALLDVVSVLEDRGIEYKCFEDVEENPSVECCTRIANDARGFNPDFLFGIGGGSSMDAAKCASVLLTQEDDSVAASYELLFKKPADAFRRPYACKPVICVPTTAGSSSEMTGFFVLTREDSDTKDTPKIMVFSAAALLDSKYIKNAPQFILDTGAMDALSHGIETSLNVNSNFLNRQIAMIGFGLFRTFKDRLITGDLTDEDYDNIMLHSCIQGMAFFQAGTLIPHGMGYYLSHHKGLNHGLACSITEGEYLKVIEDQSLVTPILEACGFKDVDDFAAYVKIMTNRDVNISVTNAECEQWARDFVKLEHRLVRHPGKIGYDEIVKIYKDSLSAYIVD